MIRNAQTKGLKIYGETCPQYLFLTADDIAKPGVEGAKFCCSPPPRDEAAQQAVWTGLRNGTFQVFSSDHAPYRFDASGKLPHGDTDDLQGNRQRRARASSCGCRCCFPKGSGRGGSTSTRSSH